MMSAVNPDHPEHEWRMVSHLDGCHYYLTTYACVCGAARTTTDERDLNEDPYTAVWMDPAERKPCARCQELMAGAPPRHTDNIVLPA